MRLAPFILVLSIAPIYSPLSVASSPQPEGVKIALRESLDAIMTFDCEKLVKYFPKMSREKELASCMELSKSQRLLPLDKQPQTNDKVYELFMNAEGRFENNDNTYILTLKFPNTDKQMDMHFMKEDGIWVFTENPKF